MKTILQVTGTMNRGGAEMMLMDLIRQLHNDFRFIFLVVAKKGNRPKGDFDDELKSLGIEIYYIDAVWDVGIKEFSRQFKAIIEQIGHIDVIHSHLNSKGGIISRCAYKCGIKKRIVHCHAKIIFDGSFPSRLANTIELKLQRHWIKKYATDFWGCSDDAMPSLFNTKQIKSDKAKIIHNAIDLEKFIFANNGVLRQELGLNKNDIVIGSVGRIANVKNYRLASNIIKELWKRGINVHYIVAGAKQDPSETEYMFNLLSSDKRFHYIATRNDVQNLYKDFDVYLGTSKREGLGLSVVEAQASGTPCIISTGFPKLCDMNIGLVNFIGSQNPNEWADKIQVLLTKKHTPNTNTIRSAINAAGFNITTETEKLKKYYNSN